MKVGIIGGGSSGLMAGISCADCGHEVEIIEHMNRPGKKLLLTGSGKCNLTNRDMDINHFHCNDLKKVIYILNCFDNGSTISFFEKLGLLTKERNGYYYPYQDQACAVLDILRYRLRNLGVSIRTECDVTDIIPKNSGYIVSTSAGDFYYDAVIMAQGSKAAPKTGSDGSGYELAKKLGHKIVKPLPALTQLRCKEDFFPSLAGIRCQGSVSIKVDGCIVASDKGELQLNNYGISGIPVMQVSHLAVKSLDEGKKVNASLCFLPGVFDGSTTLEDACRVCSEMLKERFASDNQKTCEESLIGLFNKNLGNCILKRCNINLNKRACLLDDKQINLISRMILDFEVCVIGANGFDSCQICQGGVDINEVTCNLESIHCKNLFFCGEILDVHGDCGGYNLQWAWSSGYVAGRIGDI